MRDSAVVRLLDDELFWYPPGRGGEPLSLADGAQRERLREILRARAPVLFAAPGSQLRLCRVAFSAGEKRHMASALPYLLEDEFASGIEDLHIASLPVARDALAVAACERRRMAQWRQRLAELGDIGQWIPEPLLLPRQPGEIALVIERGQAVARLGECEGFAAEAGMLPLLLGSVGEEAAGSVVVYGREQAADTELVPEPLRSRVQWRNGGFSAALLLSGESPRPLNLLQGEYAPRLPLRRWWLWWRWPLAASLAAFCMQLAATWLDYRQLQARNLELRRETEAAYRQALPQGSLQDAEKQLANKLRELRGEGAAGVSFVDALVGLGQAAQAEKQAGIANLSFSGRSGEMRVNFLVPDFETVERLRAALESGGLNADLESSHSQGRHVRARFRIQGRES